ncbi:MAG: AbrB family transcriptional regulator [Gloeomargaritaceae cyanobacterium C42_A2020_066]|nr:AbrB family transcriptional regulator [Gloeomargaritaceae cyanobacterium C42_A2020_066]
MADNLMELPTTPLTGKVLLKRIEDLTHLSRREKAKHCGYYSRTKNNKVRVNLADFMDALLLAKGIPLDPGTSRDGRGREPTFRVSVHKNGQIVIGAAYTVKMGLKPGDEFEIKTGYKHIHLNQVERSSELLSA